MHTFLCPSLLGSHSSRVWDRAARGTPSRQVPWCLLVSFAAVCRKHGFPRAVAERPAMKSSEGRHYRQFLQEGVMQFGRHVSSILVTFWCPWVPLATFGGTLGPRPDVFMILCPLLVAAGGVRGTLGTPCGPPWVPRCRQRSHFCRLFGDLGAEPQFSSRLGRKKEAKGSIFRRGRCA